MISAVRSIGLLLTYLIVSALAYPITDFIRWKKPPKPQNAGFYGLYGGETFDWYASSPTTVIGVFGVRSVTIRIHCETERLSDDVGLQEIMLRDLELVTNIDMTEKDSFELGDFTVYFKNNNFTGGIATIEMSMKPVKHGYSPVQINVLCRLKNKRGLALSSNVIIMDYRKTFELYKIVKLKTDSFSMHQPMNFSRYEKHFEVTTLPRPLKYEWFYTDLPSEEIHKTSEGGKPVLDIEPFEKWPVQVSSRGNLMWGFMTMKAKETLEGKRIFCRVENTVMKVYDLPKEITTSPSAESVKTMEVADFLPKAFKKFWTGMGGPVKVPCSFVIGPGKFSISWKMDGVALKAGNNNNGSRVARNYVELVGPFSFESRQVNFECSVKWEPKGGGDTQELSRNWTLEQVHKNIPRLTEDLPVYTIAVAGERVKVNCTFKNAYNVIPSATLYGLDVYDLSKAPASDKRDALKMQLQVIKDLKHIALSSSFNPKCCPFKKGDPVIYDSGVLYNSGKGNSSTHPFTCIGEVKNLYPTDLNPSSTLRQRTLVTVLPEIIMQKTPSQWNCSNCRACKIPVFHCSYEVSAEMKIDQIRAEFDWILEKNAKKLNLTAEHQNLGGQFRLTTQPGKYESSLEILPLTQKIKDLGFVTKEMFETNLRCRSRLIDSATGREFHSQNSGVQVSIPYENCSPILIPILKWILVILVIIVVIVALAVILCCLFAFFGKFTNVSPIHRLRQFMISKNLVKTEATESRELKVNPDENQPSPGEAHSLLKDGDAEA